MVWVKIDKIEKSLYNNSLLVFFIFQEKKRYSVVSDKVLKYLKIKKVSKGDKIFVMKSFSDDDKPIYLIKKYETDK